MKSLAIKALYDLLTDNGEIAYGPDKGHDGHLVEAMSVGMFLSGLLKGINTAEEKVQVTIRKCVDWLLSHYESDRGDFKGWGLSRSWDPYHHHSLNPPYSVYNITTAICLEALVEYQEGGLGHRAKEVEVALERVCGDVLSKGYSPVEGMFFYSPRPYDHHFGHNVNSYMSFSFLRYMKYCQKHNIDCDQAQLLEAIVRAAKRTWDDRLYDSDGALYFSYHHSSEWAAFKNRPNDLKHSMYTMRALYALRQNGAIPIGPTAGECIHSIQRFVKYFKLYEWPEDYREANNAYIDARLWAVGMLLVFINEMLTFETEGSLTAELDSLRNHIIEILFERYTAEGFTVWLYRPGSPHRNLPRHLAHVFRGLSYGAKSSTEDKDMASNEEGLEERPKRISRS